MNRPKLSVLNALGLGYEAVVRALWVLLVPLGLDLGMGESSYVLNSH